MHKLVLVALLMLLGMSLYFLSLEKESWVVTKYKTNKYKDLYGKVITEHVPVPVTIESSSRDIGLGLVVIGTVGLFCYMNLFWGRSANAKT